MSRDESRLVRRAGFNVIGLYRKYGRLSTDPPGQAALLRASFA